MDHPHTPVLLNEILTFSDIPHRAVFIDATIGFGGHTEALLKAGFKQAIGIDKDQHAVEYSKKRLSPFGNRVDIVAGQFSDLEGIAKDLGISTVDLVLFDLGVSSAQLDSADYGLSFGSKGPLDMRIGTPGTVTAADIVNHWPREKLKRLFTEHGQPGTNRLVDSIIKTRDHVPITRIEQLVEIIESVVPREKGIHPATRVFQALRIVVNNEVEELQRGLEQAVRLLQKNGRLLVISFHSGEDGAVKQFMRRESRDELDPIEDPLNQANHHATLKILTPKPIGPSERELGQNPRSRSARLRVASRLAG